MENSNGGSSKNKNKSGVSICSSNPTPVHIFSEDTCTLMLTAALFTIAKTWKQPKIKVCPTGERIKNTWYIHIHSRMLLLLLSCFSRVWLCATPEMAAHQAPWSLGFSRQEHWSGLPFPSPMHESEVAQLCPILTTPWTAAFQAPPSMGFSRQEYWSGVPSPSPWVGLEMPNGPMWFQIYVLNSKKMDNLRI